MRTKGRYGKAEAVKCICDVQKCWKWVKLSEVVISKKINEYYLCVR